VKPLILLSLCLPTKFNLAPELPKLVFALLKLVAALVAGPGIPKMFGKKR
jgi:hypothetical protein